MTTTSTHLEPVTPEAVQAALNKLATRAMGLTGADIERIVRRARLKARRQKRSIRYEDIEDGIRMDRPQVPYDLRWRFAIHESGHAVVHHALRLGPIHGLNIDSPGGGGYPARPGGTQRAHLFDALGVTDPHALLRLCERVSPDRQAACMLFWTLGGNQVGKGAITGWREMIVPRLDDIGLWPFDGRLADLLDTRPCVIAETYPGDVYRQLGMPRGGWSKRRQGDRQRIAKMIIPWLEARPDVDAHALLPIIEDGFGADKAGEDRFDAAVGLFGMLDVVDGRRDEGVPDIDGVRRWEGWILGHHRNDAT